MAQRSPARRAATGHGFLAAPSRPARCPSTPTASDGWPQCDSLCNAAALLCAPAHPWMRRNHGPIRCHRAPTGPALMLRSLLARVPASRNTIAAHGRFNPTSAPGNIPPNNNTSSNENLPDTTTKEYVLRSGQAH